MNRILASVLLSLVLLSTANAAADTRRVLASVAELFYNVSNIYATLNPTGDIAIIAGADKKRDLELRAFFSESGQQVILEDADTCPGYCSLVQLEWIDDDRLLAGWSDDSLVYIEFQPAPNRQSFTTHRIRSRGTIIDPLSHMESRVLFQSSSDSKSAYLIDPALLTTPNREWRKLLDSDDPNRPVVAGKLDEYVAIWISDTQGRIRGAVSVDGDPSVAKIWFRASEEAPWETVYTQSDPDKFEDLLPFGFTPDGEQILVASSIERDRYGLYEFDPKTGKVGKLLWENASADLHDVGFEHETGNLLSVTYLAEGEYKRDYFDTEDTNLQARLDQLFPNRNPLITALSTDRQRATILDETSEDPGAYVFVDFTTGTIEELGRIRPWLDNNLLATSQVFEVNSSDGLRIEAYLTRPPIRDVETPPLIVLPHGGPIGISDVRAFSPDIQYLARMGFAILQVNYRGSGQKGKAFERAGNRQWGRGIEDDIEAALDHVIAKQWIDPSRICTSGGSYGGYSALMLVIRRPDQYRCAASFAGVTDISLLFNAEDLFGGEAVVERLEKIVGDPDADYAEQLAYSPVYQAGKTKVPVLLAHGDWDRRVDPDHMVRMKLALDLEDSPVRTIVLRKTGHGFSRQDDAVLYYKTLRNFFKEHLQQ